jgi:cold shock CspA family protein
MIHLFDDPALDQHIRSLQKLTPPQRKSGAPMFYGICSRWNGQRGYGWITSDAPVTDVPDRELFCHASGLPKGVRALSAGDRVEFTTRKSRAVGKPPEARVIKIIEAAAEAA